MALKVDLAWQEPTYYRYMIELDDATVVKMTTDGVDLTDAHAIWLYVTMNTEMLDGATPVDYGSSEFDFGSIVSG